MTWAPKITGAEPIIGFELSDEYRATLMRDIEAPELIQCHYLLVILGRDDQPCLIMGSEWSSLDPSYRNEPVFGIFTEEEHRNMGVTLNLPQFNGHF